MRAAATFMLIFLTAGVAEATLLVDQQQTGIDATYPPLEIGGPQDKRLAQTFTVGIEGVMREVHLPVQCESGVLLIEIFSVDGDLPAGGPGMLWDRGLMPAASLPPMETPEFRSIPLEELPPVPGDRFPIGSPSFFSSVGRRLSMVISNPTGTCSLFRGVAVDPYAGGHGFFDERPLPRGWVRLEGSVEPSDDLPFKTIMDGDPPSRPCDLFDVSPDPDIPAFLPVCRCLEDPVLLEQRCGLFHPWFFLVRRVPLPVLPGDVFKVSWTLTPLTDLAGDIELKELLPKEIQASMKKPLVFRTGHVKPGASVTLDYKAVAVGGKGGTFDVETVVTSPTGVQKPEIQTMRSIIEVEPPK